MPKPAIAMIAAVDANLSLARADGTFLWPHIESDIKFYRGKIKDHTVIMGTTTFEEQSQDTLNEVDMVVLSRQSREELTLSDDIKLIGAPEDALKIEPITDDNIIYVAGGGVIYKLMLPYADIIYLSEIETSYDDPGDNVKFPKFDKSEWEVEIEAAHTDEEVPFTVRKYKRKQ